MILLEGTMILEKKVCLLCIAPQKNEYKSVMCSHISTYNVSMTLARQILISLLSLYKRGTPELESVTAFN